ncbi:MAG: glycosyltransferase family 4 protein [Lachnospiraceae bacterium]|nr:glycosyltransferase family 4 protein [Lachnospiraceae bacterium]MBQ8947855.1 glycosyltransferase family 4 protein [Lachnospiraceae bacterium]
MRYLLIQSWKDLGGAERQAINLAEHIKKRGDEATIMCLTEPGKVSAICAEKGIDYVSLQPRNTPYVISYKLLNKLGIRRLSAEEVALKGLIRDLRDHIKKNGYDICISYCAYANTVLGNARAEGADAICIWSQRDAGFHDHKRGLQQKAADSVDGIFSNSTSGSEWVKKTYGHDPKLIYNGVNISAPIHDREGWRRKLGASDTDVVCTMVANLTPFKDHMFLLKTWKKLRAIDDRFVLVFAGKYAAEYENLKKYADENGLNDKVRFLGPVDDVYGLWNATDICVHSARPHCEGTPNAVIEAGMCGLPVVGPDLPEICEAVSDANIAYLHEYDDVDRAIELLRLFADDRELAEKLGRANSDFAHNTYDPERNLDRIMEYAESLLQRR